MTSRRALRAAALTLMIAGLGLVAAPIAASAHTGKLFTYSSPSFAEISQTDAKLTQLADVTENITGADICDELSWAVADEGERIGDSYVLSWNHDTGAIGTPVALSADPADFDNAESVDIIEVWAADSLPGPDCQKLVYIRYLVDDGEVQTEFYYVAFVDLATGETTPVIQLPSAFREAGIVWQGIATDPVTGYTYLFAEWENAPYVSFLDVEAGEQSEIQPMEGLFDYFFESGGSIREADFQPDGKLWMLYLSFQAESYFLISWAPNSDLTIAEPTEIGDPNEDSPDYQYNGEHVLTYDPAALPATGGAPLGLLVAGGALLVTGAVVAAAGARSRVKVEYR